MKIVSNLQGFGIRQEWCDIVSNIEALLAGGKIDQVLTERDSRKRGTEMISHVWTFKIW